MFCPDLSILVWLECAFGSRLENLLCQANLPLWARKSLPSQESQIGSPAEARQACSARMQWKECFDSRAGPLHWQHAWLMEHLVLLKNWVPGRCGRTEQSNQTSFWLVLLSRLASPCSLAWLGRACQRIQTYHYLFAHSVIHHIYW